MFYLWVKICPRVYWAQFPLLAVIRFSVSDLHFASYQISLLPVEPVSTCLNIQFVFWLLISWIPSLRPLFLSDFLSFYVWFGSIRISWPWLFEQHRILTSGSNLHHHCEFPATLSPNFKLIYTGQELIFPCVHLPPFTFLPLITLCKPWFLITIWSWHGEATVSLYNIWLLFC